MFAFTQGFINAGRLTGQGSNEELSMTENQQKDVLDRFRKGDCNLLIATDIGNSLHNSNSHY